MPGKWYRDIERPSHCGRPMRVCGTTSGGRRFRCANYPGCKHCELVRVEPKKPDKVPDRPACTACQRPMVVAVRQVKGDSSSPVIWWKCQECGGRFRAEGYKDPRRKDVPFLACDRCGKEMRPFGMDNGGQRYCCRRRYGGCGRTTTDGKFQMAGGARRGNPHDLPNRPTCCGRPMNTAHNGDSRYLGLHFRCPVCKRFRSLSKTPEGTE